MSANTAIEVPDDPADGGKNDEFVDAVARSNVQGAIAAIRSGSPILSDLETKGNVKMVGSMYDIRNGKLTFL
ncbi:hypothetical protein AB4Y40_06330 [Paraburkholderia sp. EG287B]|uniref:hypothetical protein n=1 Tax=unclassified Paraburkholderia TaxID=2615204 RepID=UPI0034D35603